MAKDAEHWEAVEEAAELLLEGERQKALSELRRVLKDDPRNPYGYFYLATALYEIDRLEASRDAFRAAATLSPDYVGAHVGLSHVLRQLGEHREALEVAEAARKRFADDGDLMYALALALAALGERAKATKMLKRYLRTNPELEVQLEVRGTIDALAQGLEGDPFELAPR